MTATVPTDHANSFQAVALRVTRLNADGTPVTAAGNSWITNQFVSMGFTPTYQAGADLAQLAADGSLCADYKSPDMLRYAALAVAICNPEPELMQLMGGGELFSPSSPPGSPVTGYAAPDHGVIPNPNGVSIEVWSRAIINGKPAAVRPFWAWVFPYAQLWPTGEVLLENGLPGFQFSGYGYGNPEWNGGVDSAWPFTSDRAYQYARTAAIPAITNGWNTGSGFFDGGTPSASGALLLDGGTPLSAGSGTAVDSD